MKFIVSVLFFSLACAGLFGQVLPENALDHYLPEFSSRQLNIRDFALSPEGDEIYFSVESIKKSVSFIVFSHKTRSGWSPVEVVSFSGQYRDIEPAFSPDGKQLYFASNRPIDETSEDPKDYDIWVVSRTKPGQPWSKPKNLGKPVNSENNEFFPAITLSNNIFFTSTLADTKGLEDIYVCKFKDGQYLAPESLSTAINTAAYEFNAWVAPDESLIIFTSYGREDGNGGGDLYYSRKDEYGKWSHSLNFGSPINSSKLDYCPFYDQKTNTLYFTSERTAVKNHYPERLNFDAFLKEISQSENGLGRIYRIEYKFKQ